MVLVRISFIYTPIAMLILYILHSNFVIALTFPRKFRRFQLVTIPIILLVLKVWWERSSRKEHSASLQPGSKCNYFPAQNFTEHTQCCWIYSDFAFRP